LRVLLADDHVGFAASVSRFLSPALDIVGVAANGRQALELATRLLPDVVVLDVAMPELDGFQTLDLLRRADADTRVVFLTMHGDDDFVSAAIDAGAYGYVLKSRVYVDLISAIGHAVAGRLFVPSIAALATVAGSRHAVQFHNDDRHLTEAVTELVGATLRSGEQVVLVTSEETRTAVAQRLQARHMNLALLAGRGQYIELDSAVALSQIMKGGRPDEGRVREIIHTLDRRRLAVADGPRSRMTIVGDMTVSLCRDGLIEAALEIERMWHELTRSLSFFTVCNYPISCFQESAARNQLPRLCAEHSAVIS
jgi:DNA-binding NarL/FixJ family response regulator